MRNSWRMTKPITNIPASRALTFRLNYICGFLQALEPSAKLDVGKLGCNALSVSLTYGTSHAADTLSTPAPRSLRKSAYQKSRESFHCQARSFDVAKFVFRILQYSQFAPTVILGRAYQLGEVCFSIYEGSLLLCLRKMESSIKTVNTSELPRALKEVICQKAGCGNLTLSPFSAVFEPDASVPRGAARNPNMGGVGSACKGFPHPHRLNSRIRSRSIAKPSLSKFWGGVRLCNECGKYRVVIYTICLKKNGNYTHVILFQQKLDLSRHSRTLVGRINEAVTCNCDIVNWLKESLIIIGRTSRTNQALRKQKTSSRDIRSTGNNTQYLLAIFKSASSRRSLKQSVAASWLAQKEAVKDKTQPRSRLPQREKPLVLITLFQPRNDLHSWSRVLAIPRFLINALPSLALMFEKHARNQQPRTQSSGATLRQPRWKHIDSCLEQPVCKMCKMKKYEDARTEDRDLISSARKVTGDISYKGSPKIRAFFVGTWENNQHSSTPKVDKPNSYRHSFDLPVQEEINSSRNHPLASFSEFGPADPKLGKRVRGFMHTSRPSPNKIFYSDTHRFHFRPYNPIPPPTSLPYFLSPPKARPGTHSQP
ncbi:uncharacterized protein BDR25DRAFT_359676 [Lindgomyces ingoldianus]|uniref:Uncharacterized protein n=1 Tax=Lindgomyces ingoldianus TaxID=673940 RepID=A0ACB6QHE9_9PLEO|nr:uncharacterized protein BDR25DRAFT_359676 [Lindgomyces ingoldianus]KAF2466307.1 hypothetical protein BDR25DRAFT_359676 [Lindgomyces ingoldianus]